MYCRIRLQETNYQEYHNYRILGSSSFERCLEIYKDYIRYKKFEDTVPIFREEFEIPHKLSSVINEKDLQIDRLSKMALEDPSTNGNPKKLNIEDMKIMYQHSMSGNLF